MIQGRNIERGGAIRKPLEVCYKQISDFGRKTVLITRMKLSLYDEYFRVQKMLKY